MAKRTSRRAIRDKLDQAASATEKAESLLAGVVAAYYERGTDFGILIELMRESLQTQAQQIRDFRRQRS